MNQIVRRTLRVFVVLLACLVAPTGVSAADDGLKGLTKKFKAAISAKNPKAATDVAKSIAALDTADAVDVLVNIGLVGDMYSLEKTVGGLCLRMQSQEALERMCFLARKHKRYESRVLLTLVLGRRPETEAFAAVLRNLYDRFVSVVLASLEAIEARDQLGAVDHLIKALGHHEKAPGGGDELLKFEIRKLLTKFTGEDLQIADDWENFWEPRKNNFVRPNGKRDSKSVTGVQRKGPKFFNIEVPDSRVLFLLDISGSMKKKDPAPEEAGERGDGDGDDDGPSTGVRPKPGKKKGRKPKQSEIPDSRMRLARVQKELIRVIGELPADTEFDIVTFNHTIGHFKFELVKANSKHKTEAIRFVRDFRPEGQTHTDEALRAAFEVEGVTTIFLLSDGAPRRNDVLMEIQPILDEVREMNRFRRVRLHTIGFKQVGSNLRKFMRKIASQNKGQYSELR